MYFALLCCPLLMTNVLHLPSGPIVFRSESHNVVKFFQPESRGWFSGFFPRVPPLSHFIIASRWNNTFPVRKVTHPHNPLVFCWSFAVVGYFVWWFQTCLLVRLNRILYDLHAKLRQYVFKRRSTILRYVKRRFH